MILQARLRIILTFCVLILFAGYYIIVDIKTDLKDFKQSTGTIIYFNKQFLNHPGGNNQQYRYVSIANYPFMFECKVGKYASLIDKLQTGDIVTLYYNDMGVSTNKGINKSLQCIEKDKKKLFEASSKLYYIGIILIMLSVFIAIISFIFYKKGKLLL